MDKYYVPSESELHEGLEFEYLFYDEDLDEYVEGKWIKTRFDYRSGLGHDLSHQFDEQTVRVKLLDHNDIAEFGFVLFNGEDVFEKHISNYRGRQDLKCHIVFRKTLLIIIGDDETTWSDWHAIFTGEIKNKCALKTLLTQLGI